VYVSVCVCVSQCVFLLLSVDVCLIVCVSLSVFVCLSSVQLLTDGYTLAIEKPH